MKKDPFFIVRNGYRTLLTIALMPIKQYTVAVHCFQMFTFTFCSILVQAILQDYSLLFTHKTSKQRQRTHTPCTADSLRRQCIKVRAHKRYMQSKKTKFCMQYCKPRYLSITDKNHKRFRSRMNILSTILNWLQFCKLYCMCFFFRWV